MDALNPASSVAALHAHTEAREPSRAPLSAWFALGVLVLVQLGALIDRNVLTVATEPLRDSLHLSDVQIGLLQGLGLTLAAAVGSIPMAWLADRFDRRWVLAGCVLAWSATTAWRAFATSFDVLFASSIGLAVAEACLAPIVYAMIPSLFHGKQRAIANLVFYTLGVFGWSLATAASGLLLKTITDTPLLLPAWLQTLELWRARLGDTLAVVMGQGLNVAAVVPLIAFAFAGSANSLYAALVVLTICQVAYNATMPAVWQAIAPPHLRARVVAIMATVVIAGGALGPLIVGVVSDCIGSDRVLDAIALVGAPALLASAALLRWVMPRLRTTLAAVRLA